MKLVILDGYTSNPGDLTWDRFQKFGELSVYDRTPPDQVVERAKEAEIVLTNKTVLDQEIISSLLSLQYIGVLATGYNVVDMECARKKNITVTNVPNYAKRSGAQSVIALLLELTNRVGQHSHAVFNNKWCQSKDFCFWDFPLIELDGKTFGIVGYGGIGKAVAEIAIAFGMNVLVSTRTVPEVVPKNTVFCDLDTLFQNSDVISLHCPLTPKTEGLINRERLAQMKTTSYIINVSRGLLIDETALATALNNGDIAGAALDVLAKEPPDLNCPLLKAKNCFITPHIAWATLDSRRRLLDIAASNIEAFLNNQKQNVIE